VLGHRIGKKFNFNVAAKWESFSDFYRFINLVKSENITLVPLTNAYNFSRLIKFKEKNLVHKAN